MANTEPAVHTLDELQSDCRNLVHLALDHPVLFSLDGGNHLVLLSEKQLRTTDEIIRWFRIHLHASTASRKPASERTSGDFPGAPWLVNLDDEDLTMFLNELRSSLLFAADSGQLETLDRLASAWESTAIALGDPERRSVPLGRHRPDDFVEIQRPA